MRRQLIVAAIMLAVATVGMVPSVAEASCYTSGYTRSNGTYVNGYSRSCPDSTVTNNYTFYGNDNPYTGERGANRYYSSPSSPYYSPWRSSGSYWP